MRVAFCLVALLFLVGVDQLQCGEGLRSAMIGGGADSVAAKLHYPPKERDSKTEAVVVFFCEVLPMEGRSMCELIGTRGTIVSATRWRKR